MIVKYGFKRWVKDAVMINYLSLYLCIYGLRGKEAIGVVLVEKRISSCKYEKPEYICFGLVPLWTTWFNGFKCILAPYPLVHRLYGWFSYSHGCLMNWFGYGCGWNCMDNLIMDIVGHYMCNTPHTFTWGYIYIFFI